jgi:RHS repeat-associated protein
MQTEVALRSAWFRTLVVVLSLALALPGLSLLPARPAAAAPTTVTTTAPAPSDKPSLTDRLKGLLGGGQAGAGGYNGQATLPHPATKPASKPPLKPKRVKELTGKRTARAKFFELEDGRVEAELSAVPVHYRDANDEWRAIDTQIAKSDRSGFGYGNTTNRFGSLFGTNSERLLRFEQAGRQVTVGLPGAAKVLAPRVRGSQLTYPGLLDGADLVYQVTPEGVKEQIVLARPPTDPVWRFTMRLGGVDARQQPDGSIAFLPDGGGDVPLFVIPKPFMTDAADDLASPYGKRFSDKVTQTVSQQGSNVEITVRADAAWLAAADRRYPVVVDPTIKIQPISWEQSLDVEIRSDAPTTNFDGTWQLAVGSTPAMKARSLIKFPLTDLPSGVQLTTAQLQTWFDGSWGPDPGLNDVVIEARRVTAPWADTTATWNSINTAIGEAGLSTATRAKSQSAAWHSFDVKNIVQTWLNGTQPNHGFMLKASNETLNQGGPIYEAAPGLFYDYGGETQNGPKLLVTYGRPSVNLAPPTKITATGAQLSWSAYADPSGSPDDDLVEYQVHRRLNGSSSTTPTCGPVSWDWCRYTSRVAVVPVGTTSYLDTSAPPTPADDPSPNGKAYDYWVVVKTRDGQASASGVQVAWLPKAGRTKVIVQGSALDTTLTSKQPTTGHDVFDGRPWLGVGNNSTTYGITRTLLKFDASAVPATATVRDVEVSLWHPMTFGTQGANATYRLHKLTKAFSETAASWDNATSTTPWATKGGDFTSTILATVTGLNNAEEPKWRTWRPTSTNGSLRSTVQGWVTDPSTNLGFLVKQSSETTPAERALFLSSEVGEPLLRPRMVVTYTERTAESTYHAPATPERMTAGTSYTVPVTVTNTTTGDLKAAEQRLTYRWKLPDGTVDPNSAASEIKTALPRDLPPGDTVTVDATIKAITPTDPGSRLAYVPTWDLYNQTTGTFLSATAGIPGLGQKVGVERPTSNELGLEKFYQYVGKNTGSGTAALVNQHSGNLAWSYDPIANPGRGPATFVRMTYNSQDTSASSMGFGWSLSAASVMRLGTPLQFHPPGQSWPTTVNLTDGDGTTHTFTLNKHGSSDPAAWDYDHPFGVHLYLQKNSSGDAARAWTMTRPDRTQFLFDADGYQSATRDKNGNELLFTYEHRKSNNKPIKFLKYLTDAAARQTLTLTNYAKGQSYSYYDSSTGQKVSGTNLTNPQIIDQIQTITDISNRKISLVYSDKGLLKELVDGSGTSLAKTFLFDYDMTQGNKNVKLVKVTDPRGKATNLAYYSPPNDDPKFHWWAKTITDRRGNATGFAYVDPDGPQGSVMETTVTDAEQHATFCRTDGFGRPVLTRDAKQQETSLVWDADHNVTRLQEANGAVSTWTYDPKTGFPLTITDAQANADGTAATTLTYQTSLNGFVAEPTEKRSPEGRRWAFGYDSFGNLTSVTDPKGTATTTPDDFNSTYQYDGVGQLTKATDANEHATLFGSYDPTGYPKTITDARTKATGFTYDVRGNVLTVTDPRGKTTSQAYDLFGRPGENRTPKNQATNDYVITPAPVYDANDNIITSTAPNGAQTTAVYDNADLLTSVSLPKDETGDPARTVAYTYDKVGNLRTQTEPKGTLTSDPDDFVTTSGYDEIYQLVSVTNANNERLTYAYDNVGNVTTVVDPRKNATADPLDYTTKYGYDRSHRVLNTTDAAGKQTATDYDLDGLAVSSTDQEGNITLTDRDERGMPREVKVPHDNPGGGIVYHTTRYEYDEVGNQIRVITPRGTATTDDPDDFAYGTVYDELNRVKEQLLPFDRDDPQITTPDKVTYAYDDVGNLTQVSAPPSAGQMVRNITTYSHFDNGWVKSTTDPWDIATVYDYNPLGQQTSRTITSAGGSSSRAMSWTYFPDGKLSARTDDGVPVGRQVVLVDNSDTQNVAVTGTWPTATSGSGYQGIDYRTHAAGTGSATFTWKLHVPQSGTYEAFARYPSGGTATNAPFKVEHSAGSTTKAVNQTQQAGTWVSLGSFSFTEGDGGTGRQVTLSDNAGGTVVADAVKLVRDNNADPDSERKNLTYRYDPNSNLVSTSDSSPGARVDAYTVTYDGLNRVDKVQERNGGVTGTIRNTTSFTYDPNGNPATRSHDDEHATYTYDTRDLVATATNGTSASDPDPKVTGFTYTPRGQKLRETKANDNTVDHTYFFDGLLKTQVEKKANGTLVSSHTLAYDPNGHRTSDAAKRMNADNHAAYLDQVFAYTYDPRDRIRQVTKSAAGGGVLETETYTHDANNNVISQTVDNATTNFTYDRNRLQKATTGAATAAYNYDPFGRLDKVTSGTTVLERYVYDGFDRVTEHRKNDGTGTDTTRYAYDPLDRTTSRTAKVGAPGQKQTDFNYLGLSGEVLSEEVAGQVQVAYQYSPWGQRLSQVKFQAGGVTEDSFYGYNPHSDVETLTNEAGDTRATYGYTAYGRDDKESFTGIDKPDAQNPTAEPYNVYRFNAKRFDPTSGDYDMGFRDYDPGLNRFLSRDSYNGALADLDLGMSPWTMNRYGFAGGNPVSFIELDGHIGGLPDEDLRELRKAGYTYVMGKGVVPLPGGASGGSSQGGSSPIGSSQTDQDPLNLAQAFAACAAGEFGEAIAGAGQAAAQSDNQLPALHLTCNTLQHALGQVQLAGGPTMLVPGVIPGFNLSGGGAEGGGGVESAARGSREGAEMLRRAAEVFQRARGFFRGTTAVALVQNRQNRSKFELWISAENTEARPEAWKGYKNLKFIGGPGHAEENIANAAEGRLLGREWDIIEGGTSTTICPDRCAPILEFMERLHVEGQGRMFWRP